MRPVHATISTAVLVYACLAASAAPDRLTRADLLEDTRELMRTVESVHPDPYLRGGGKIALHKRFQKTMGSIPDEGLTRDEYIRLIEPLLAAIGDGHTFISSAPGRDPYAPGGVPLYFEVATDGLFVLAVLEEAHRELLGARLIAVEKVPVETLQARLERIRAADNIYHLQRALASQGALWYGDRLRRILPEWTRRDSVSVDLVLPGGSRRSLDLSIPERVDYASLILPPSSDPGLLVELMTEMQRSDIFYRFLDPERTTCLLVIRSLMSYREAFEVWHSFGITSREPEARALYQRYTGRPAPAAYAEVLAGLPSATEIFSEMREAMRRAGTRTLLVDLSQNDGGSSMLSSILVTTLYGRQAVIDGRAGSREITKLSPEYFLEFPSPSLVEINEGRPFPLADSDYLLDGSLSVHVGPPAGQAVEELELLIRRMPTFASLWGSPRADSPYTPGRVLALCDAGTYSAAFTVLVHLKHAGAEIVGIPSAQSGNCFGDVMRLELPRSGVGFQISRKYFELYPDDPEAGRVLIPDHVMTTETLASYGFDPLALIRFAADIAGRDHRP